MINRGPQTIINSYHHQAPEKRKRVFNIHLQFSLYNLAMIEVPKTLLNKCLLQILSTSTV